jgi:hypothetical protein
MSWARDHDSFRRELDVRQDSRRVDVCGNNRTVLSAHDPRDGLSPSRPARRED